MPVVSIYSADSVTRESLIGQFTSLSRSGPDIVLARSYGDFAAFLDSGRQNPRCILVMAQPGTQSVELVFSTVEECPLNPIVWLSDLDFALFSYRLEIAHFGFLPATDHTLRTALRNCKKQRARSATGIAPGMCDPPAPRQHSAHSIAARLKKLLGIDN